MRSGSFHTLESRVAISEKKSGKRQSVKHRLAIALARKRQEDEKRKILIKSFTEFQ